ncbi:MAG: LytR C-terminal domain-containing protein [Nocardioides sp.]
MPLRHGPDDQRGWVVYPTPIVLLSIAAVLTALVLFWITGGDPDAGSANNASDTPSSTTPTAPGEAASESPTPSATPPPSQSPSSRPTKAPKPSKSASPTEQPGDDDVVRQDTLVAVLNNTSTAGLAATTAQQVRAAGWQVSGIGNWRGNIPATTVYYPPGLQDAAEVLAADLRITRLRPSVAPMKPDRLTVILAG